MITNNIKNWYSKKELQKFHKAFEFLEKSDFNILAIGKHAIDGEKIYANVIKTNSKKIDLGKFESHKKYIDIHYLISGKEIIGFANTNNLNLIKDYDEKDDSFLYDIPDNYEKLSLNPRDFAIFFPGDGHMPGCHLDKENEIYKVVIKVLVN